MVFAGCLSTCSFVTLRRCSYIQWVSMAHLRLRLLNSVTKTLEHRHTLVYPSALPLDVRQLRQYQFTESALVLCSHVPRATNAIQFVPDLCFANMLKPTCEHTISRHCYAAQVNKVSTSPWPLLLQPPYLLCMSSSNVLNNPSCYMHLICQSSTNASLSSRYIYTICAPSSHGGIFHVQGPFISTLYEFSDYD